MKYKARAPLRIDFGGGWSDIPIYAEKEAAGGAVLNAAIDVYATGYIIRPKAQASPAERLLGAAKNVVRYELDAPAGAGLGASAAQTILWLTLVKTVIANVSERRELAERAWRVENELGVLGGKQDQYASAVGGISFMAFGDRTEVESIRPGYPFTDEFERRLVLVYTGGKRLSGDIHERVWGGYQSGNQHVTQALHNIRRIAGEQRQALLDHDLDTFGALMSENWSNQKKLHETVSNERFDRFVSLSLASGAIGAKATGAGGGGCLLCLARDGAEKDLTSALAGAGARPIPFRFDWYGVHLTKG